MRDRRTLCLSRGALLVGTLLVFGCKAREDAFYARIFTCEPGDSCGTNRSGEPMMCYNTQSLGPQDFCADTCDPTAPPDEQGGYVCLSSKARFQTCNPSASPQDGSGRCPAGLNCLRTNLFVDKGLCMDIPVCTTNEDCKGLVSHNTCASTLLQGMTPAGLPLHTDGLFCLQSDCHAGTSDCKSGETCLLSVITTITSAPDVCVPTCDNLSCPPSFVCAQKVYGKYYPAVCVPGVPGYRCTTDVDCLIGSCIDTGAGFNQCTIACTADNDCRALNSLNNVYACVPNVADAGHHCVLINGFTGSFCDTDADCQLSGQRCFRYNPYRTTPPGECRYPCDDAGQCPKPGGVALVCLANGAGGCYPGRFGLPCSSDDQCTVNFKCLGPATDGGVATEGGTATVVDGPINAGLKTCTIPCATDADCDDNSWTVKSGYCEAGLCRLGAGGGTPCQLDNRCQSRQCILGDSGVSGTCGGAAIP